MKEQDLIHELKQLITKYIENENERNQLLELVEERGGSVAKGVLDSINQSSIPFDENDSKVIKDIVFYFV